MSSRHPVPAYALSISHEKPRAVAAVFPGKIRAPAAGERLVRRPRLEQKLDAGLRRGVVIISAAAGSGKTQVVASWARHRATPQNVAWVTLDEGDRDPVRFVTYALAAIAATPAGRRAGLSVGALSPSSIIDEPYLLVVSDALSRLADEVVLVIDELQAVVGSETEGLIRRILRYRPERLRVVILSRVVPALGQTRLRLQGRATDVTAQDLRMSREECDELLRLHDLTMADSEMNSIHARTQGWVAGVHVLATSIGEPGDPGFFAQGLGAGEAFLRDYLRKEVFDRQSPEVQEFLMRASTANPVCGELADALTGTMGSDRTLEELHGAHVFLDRVEGMYDERCQWYRWHPIFAGLLRQRLRVTRPGIDKQLHRTAAEWCEQHGFPAEAVRHAVAGGDVASAVRLLGETWLDLVLAGGSAELRSLLSLFDESQREEQAELAVAYGFVRLQQRDLEGATGYAERAVPLAAQLPTERQTAVETMCAAIRLHVATMTGEDLHNGYRSALILLRRLTGDRARATSTQRKRRTLLLYHLGAYEVSQWLDDEPGPREHLHEVIAAAGTLGMPDLVLRARTQLAYLDLSSGRLHSAQATAREVIDAAEGRGWRSQHSLSTANHVLGGVDVLRADLGAGLRRLGEAREIVHPVDEVNMFRIGLVSHAALSAEGSVRTARDELDRLRAQSRRWQARPRWARVLLATTEAEQLALEGQPTAALAMAESAPEVGAVHPVVRRHWEVVHGQLLLGAGKPAEARTAVHAIIADGGASLMVIRALVVDALAAETLGLHEEALHSLDTAVGRAAAEDIREPFLVSGREVRPLLHDLLSRGSAHEPQVLYLLSRLRPTRRTRTGSRSPYVVEPLTSRELEVLRALQGTASHEQIASQLFISLNTLRTHAKHIHRKLDTTSRREAVQRARDLGIL